jgi:hypothetical protein
MVDHVGDGDSVPGDARQEYGGLSFYRAGRGDCGQCRLTHLSRPSVHDAATRSAIVSCLPDFTPHTFMTFFTQAQTQRMSRLCRCLVKGTPRCSAMNLSSRMFAPTRSHRTPSTGRGQFIFSQSGPGLPWEAGA